MLVVLAEKDPHELQALRAAFEASDCEVLAAYDGKVALALTREHSPEAVVVNASLGQMGGFAVSREIKTSAEAGEHRNPKVVVLIEREADAWLAGQSRCDAWLTKPVDSVVVADLVRELVSNPGAEPLQHATDVVPEAAHGDDDQDREEIAAAEPDRHL